jgi:microsomal dipeptidase-like Zn-dependent dipeptidase
MSAIDETAPTLIDALQFCNWSREIFLQMREAGMTAVHATVSYHDGFRDTVRSLVDWNARFRDHADLILFGRDADDIDLARRSGRTAIFLGLQTPMPIEDDLGLVEILHELGIRFMQLTYNNQSLLGAGWMERIDSGVTRMGREAIAEMNRLGMIIDMSHSGERTTREAIELSARPIAITHANPSWWRETARNKSALVLEALGQSGGMLGLSLYPHHMRSGSATTPDEFSTMAREVADIVGARNLGVGSDLCQGQPDAMVRWMREGRWTRSDIRAPTPEFPAQPSWFRDNRDFPRLADGLVAAGFDESEVKGVLGENWRRFLRQALPPRR